MQGGSLMKKKKRKNKSKIIGTLILLVLGLYVVGTLYQQQQEMKALKQKEILSLQKIEEMQQDIDMLKEQLETSNEDQYIERIARQQLKMVDSDEFVVIDMGQQ